MTKEYIKSMAFEKIADMVGNPFEYAADGSNDSVDNVRYKWDTRTEREGE